MVITDTHTHLYSEAFDEDRDELIQKALDMGVKRFFVPAIDSTYTKRMLDLKNKYPDHVFLMAGLHPTHVKEDFEAELAHIEKIVTENKYFAIGEIGIDLYWDKSFLREQQEAFRRQIQLAKNNKLPIVIHCRDAFDEVFQILEEQMDEDLRGIFHCFTGNLEQAKKAIDCHMKLGIGGVVTFKNGKIDSFLNQIDIHDIVLETDAPYLAPTPFRGKRNESSYILNVLEKVADIYKMDIEQVAQITTANSKEVFGI
ncbi:TatD family hydrolase [Maribacter cobaltidurans]|uniref:Hydrolase TatD n=1 Tax=Maribacter cobaltidurans TaxID=1178778 RepID=A0A223V275_9FLAO|nr:TatD family hydrolase [Maribacter cobaltidurans]ASV29533.1 hydrolase TatD [Maribacter cobaltidurans]GGD68222.1 TatD family hydrolase [Maribacter cobaltidurans]